MKAILGYQPQELLGKSVYDFYHAEDQMQMKETFEQGRLFVICYNIPLYASDCFEHKTHSCCKQTILYLPYYLFTYMHILLVLVFVTGTFFY